MDIRAATEADIPEIQSIYAHHVLTGTGTFEEEPPSVEEMAERFAQVVARGWWWRPTQAEFWATPITPSSATGRPTGSASRTACMSGRTCVARASARPWWR